MNDSLRFMLDNSLAATSALIKDGNIYAADGKECNAHIFDLCGNFSHRIGTARAYARLRFDGDSNVFSALSCGCDGRIYCIDERFNEIGFTRISALSGRSCESSAMTDASAVTLDGERFFTVSYEKAAFLYDSHGGPIRQLCKADNDEIITDFIMFGEERFAFGTQKCGFTLITVSDNGKVFTSMLDRGLTLRMLFSKEDTVYGLFGYSYIYNRICPIYTDGVFSLPKAYDGCKMHNCR